MQDASPTRPQARGDIPASEGPTPFDTSSPEEFVQYYERESLSPATVHRFETIRKKVLLLAQQNGCPSRPFDVLDIGCGAGTECLIWSAEGDRVTGIDVNAALIEVAGNRAAAAGRAIRFDVGSATSLPYESRSIDVCLMPELLEHVQDWQLCLTEAIRVLRPGGILFLSTTNVLCPVQQEYNLPLYSWYPRPLKRRIERLVVTTRPELANYARYPAIHWFSYYGLSRFLRSCGVRSLSRFEMLDRQSLSRPKQAVAALVRNSALLRFLGQICSPSSVVFGIKG